MALGVEAQKGYDYGVFLGMTQTHLSSILPIPDTGGLKFAGGGYYRYSMNERYSVRGGIIVSPAMGDAFGLFEFNFHPLNSKKAKKVFTSYIATGLSYVVDFTEKGLFDQAAGTPADLQKLKTNFWVRNIRIPFNAGVRYNVTSRMTVGVEWCLRKGYQKDYSEAPYNYSPLMPNWRSHVGVTIGYLVSNYCKTCPFYENERKKLK